ncbi:hypothetical protein ACFQVA_09695 [Actinomadura keratinilytica]
MRRGIAATALVASLALAATACGGDTTDESGAKGGKSGGELAARSPGGTPRPSAVRTRSSRRWPRASRRSTPRSRSTTSTCPSRTRRTSSRTPPPPAPAPPT